MAKGNKTTVRSINVHGIRRGAGATTIGLLLAAKLANEGQSVVFAAERISDALVWAGVGPRENDSTVIEYPSRGGRVEIVSAYDDRPINNVDWLITDSDQLIEPADYAIWVMRSDYLSLYRAQLLDPKCADNPEQREMILVIGEPGRVLGIGDIADCLSVPVMPIAWDAAVMRAGDAGLLLRRELRGMVGKNLNAAFDALTHRATVGA